MVVSLKASKSSSTRRYAMAAMAAIPEMTRKTGTLFMCAFIPE